MTEDVNKLKESLKSAIAQKDQISKEFEEYKNKHEAEMTQHIHELEVSKERLELCWRGAGDGMWDWDFKTDEVVISDRWKKLLGYEPHEVENQFYEWKNRLHPEDSERVLGVLYGHIKNQTPYKVEYRMKKKNGEWNWFQDRGQAIWNSDGVAFRMAGSLRDINERKLEQKELEESKKFAEAANKAKSDFLAIMSHEIRTPMNGIIGMANLLAESKVTKQQKEYIDLIVSSAENLLHIINDILDFSKIEAGKIELEFIEFDLMNLAQGVISLLSILAKNKGIKLILNYDTNTPRFVIGDHGRIRQIFANLLSNAVKFTEKGEVKIDVKSSKAAGNKVHFEISFTDAGIGIPQDKLEKIFTKFSQADASTTRRFGGTGLGLPICRELSHLMGGDIKVTSVVGGGSTFTLLLDLKLASEDFITKSPTLNKGEVRKKITFPKVKILLVEDNLVNQKLMIAVLNKYECTVTLASDGKDSLEKFNKQKFDLIFMDCQMPIMDGYEATREIRNLESKNGLSRTPVIAVTANALTTDKQKCLDAGMDGYTSKPFTRDSIEMTLMKFTPQDRWKCES